MLDLKLFACNSNPPLAEKIARYLEIPLGNLEVRQFSDGEVFVEIRESVRGKDVFVLQSTCSPVNNNLMELLITVDALKRASAASITAVIPYYGYARQDRKVAPRTPITAKLVADLLAAAGTSRIISMDLHAGQIQGFFNVPFDHLYGAPVLLHYLHSKNFAAPVVFVSPDAGGVERARAFAKRMDAQLAIIDKRRTGPNEARAMNIIGEILGKIAIILDDMIDTAGTLTEAVNVLLEKGAVQVLACCTHPVFSGQAYERIAHSAVAEVITTDTIVLSEKFRKLSKIKVLSVAELLGETIKRIQLKDSVSSLFV